MSPSKTSKQDKQQQADAAEGGAGKKQDYQTNMPVGEILRRAREHFGQSLADVENAIRIRSSQIDAIEKSQYDRLPGRVYSIGFVRSYSEYLGFDGDKMVALFKTQSVGGGRIKPELNFPAPASESRTPPLGLVIAGLALFIAFMVVWASDNQADPEDAAAVPSLNADAPADVTELPRAAQDDPAESGEISPQQAEGGSSASAVVSGPAPAGQDDLAAGAEEEIESVQGADDVTAEAPESPADAGQASATASTSDSTSSPASVPAPAPAEAGLQQEGITLNVKENSWVEIRDQSGKAIVSRMLKTGDQYFVPHRPDLFMSLGNAGGIEVMMDGKPLPPFGKKGEVRKNISLDIKSLKALASPR